MAQEVGGGGGILRVLFWGTPLFALPCLRALGEEGHEIAGVVTQPDRPSGRGRKLTASPVKEAALEEGLPVLTPARPKGPAFLDELRALEPDVSVVVAYGHILGREVLDLPPVGSFNVHASLLPELRGAAPVNWAILRGQARTGVSIMRMAEAMDAGPVLLQVAEEIGATDTATHLATRLSELGAQALIEALALLAEGAIEEQGQDHSRATFAPKIGRDMARIEWSRPARELDWHLRGLDAVPGAWSVLKGDPVKLFSPTLRDRPNHGAEPGTVLSADEGGGLVVACGEGALQVREIQSSGKKRMPVSDWLRGNRLSQGVGFE